MQCPVCEHAAPAADFGEPLRCPGCGAYYEKAVKSKAQQAAEALIKPDPRPAMRSQSDFAAHSIKALMSEYTGAQPVVVLDLKMPFNSMIMFMIKWALASIPALLILMVIGFFSAAILGGLAGLSR